jgi:hypothetical protein
MGRRRQGGLSEGKEQRKWSNVTEALNLVRRRKAVVPKKQEVRRFGENVVSWF